MPTRTAVHLSTQRDPTLAGREAAGAALAALGGQPDLALVFATAGYAQEPLLAAIRATVGARCVVAGCSGEGAIAHGTSQEVDHAVSVMAIAFEGVEVEGYLTESYERDSAAAAQELACRIGKQDDIVGLYVFPDGLRGDCSAFLNALEHALPGVLVVGGTAGDAMAFERTYQYGEGKVRSGAVSAVILRGQGRMRVAVSHGCTPCGPHQRITRSSGNWIEEIDGRPAWDVFKELLDGDPEDLNAEGIVHLCVGVATQGAGQLSGEPLIVRTPFALNKATGALLFPGGGLSQGQTIRIARRDAEQIRLAASSCARSLREPGRTDPAFVLQFDCAGRGKIFFGDHAAAETIEPLRAELGHEVPWAGFHTYGEIASTQQGLNYHNYTVAVCAYYDA